jgi:serine/threonine protein kinase
MTSPFPEPDAGRWRRVEEICDAALKLSESERDAYLADACGSDRELRREVEALLAHEHTADGFLSAAQNAAAVQALSEPGRDLSGSRLGDYEILNKLGEGGMGIVYRAHDHRLDRDVALKLVTRQSGTDNFARLRNEARAAARLNHPNICTVFEATVSDGVACIAMELVDGAPLNASIPSGGWPSNRVCTVGRQIADALAHAHAHGVTHRDLKSSNVMIGPEGGAKVIDFGIAYRVMRPVDQTETERSLPSGLAGTLSYLAPELLNGGAPTAQSDLWSLGIVLYEMAAGHVPFAGNGAPELAAAILRDRPAALPAGIAPELSRVIEQCLAKNPADRQASAAAVATALEMPVDAVGDRKRSLAAPVLAAAIAVASVPSSDLIWQSTTGNHSTRRRRIRGVVVRREDAGVHGVGNGTPRRSLGHLGNAAFGGHTA